jgi:hypothetical protein
MSQGGWGPNPDYTVKRNSHGAIVEAGPSTAGPHRNVWDYWETTKDGTRWKGNATVRCKDCGAEWPEGNVFPQSCTPAAAIVQQLRSLSPEQRSEVLGNFCPFCGDHDPEGRCCCMRDE